MTAADPGAAFARFMHDVICSTPTIELVDDDALIAALSAPTGETRLTPPTDPAQQFAELLNGPAATPDEPTPTTNLPAPNTAQGASGRGGPLAPDPREAFADELRDRILGRPEIPHGITAEQAGTFAGWRDVQRKDRQ